MGVYIIFDKNVGVIFGNKKIKIGLGGFFDYLCEMMILVKVLLVVYVWLFYVIVCCIMVGNLIVIVVLFLILIINSLYCWDGG